MSDAPIFVVGFQRSGTTLLQSLIGSHPRVAAPPEMFFLFRIARLADSYGDLADDANLRRALLDALHPPLETLRGAGFDDEAVLDRARKKPRTMRGLFEAIMEDFAERHGKARWSDKTPAQPASAIHRMFPDAQVLHIVRDPRDVIASALETPWTTASAFQLAHRWRAFTRSNIRHGMLVGPDRYLQLSYEQLTRHPVTTLSRICAFLGEAFDPEMVRDTSRRRPSIVAGAGPWQAKTLGEIEPAVEGRWKTRLSRRDRVVVGSIVAGELIALGYEPESRRRRIAGRLLAAPDVVKQRWTASLERRRTRVLGWRERATREFLDQQAALMRADAKRRAREDTTSA